MGLAHEKKSYLQEKANLFEIGSTILSNLSKPLSVGALADAAGCRR